MTEPFGAPGTGVSRRKCPALTGAAAVVASTAGCPTSADQGAVTATVQQRTTNTASFPTTGSPEGVQADEQGGAVTLQTPPARHEVHPSDSMGGPVELPKAWAFQADDGTPSVPGPVPRTTEGSDIGVTLDDTDSNHPHTLHFHGVRKTWENDGVPTTTGITVSNTPTRFRPTFRGCTCITATTMSTWGCTASPASTRRCGPADREYCFAVSPVLSRLLRGSPAQRRRPARPG